MAPRMLTKLRYDKNEYGRVNHRQPRELMHPIKPELADRDVSGEKDPDGSRFGAVQRLRGPGATKRPKVCRLSMTATRT